MTFLNPLVLLGLAAAGIPLIIHLFNFRRPQRIDFSSLAFVRELEKTTMRRVRIKQWLLLLMRTLAIASLVLAFARPTLTGGLAGVIGGDSSAAIGILLDNSRSLDVRDSRGSVFAQAVAAATAVVDQASDDDAIIIRTTAGPTSLQSTTFNSRDGARDFLGSVTVEDGARPVAEVTAALAGALGDSGFLNKELYIVGDAQESTLGDSIRVDLPDDIHLRLVKLNDRPLSNIGVTGARVLSRIVELGQPVEITADVANYGTSDLTDYVLSVFLDEQRVAQATVNVPAGGTNTARFTATPPARGWLQGAVRGETDDFASDDERFFTLHVPRERRVLVVQGDAQRIDYVTLALSPSLSRDGGLFFRTTAIGEQNLPAERVDGYDAVVLVGLRSISSGEVAVLSQYVEQGGGLLIFPGTGADFGDYDQLFSAIGGGRVTGIVGSAGSGVTSATLADIEVEHPLFDGVFDEESLRRGRTVEQLSVYSAAVYEPSRPTEQTLIGLTSGSPFMQEMRHGSGAALWIAVAPDPAWSELPVRGLFVPLLYRSMFYLSAGEQSGGEQLTVGQPAEIRLSGVPRGADIALRGPGGDEFVPEQRNLFGGLLLQVGEQITRPGVYDVFVRTADGTEEPIRRIAFNLGAEESDLTLLAAEEAARALEASLGSRVVAVSGADAGYQEIGRAIREARTGAELWNVFLMLALAFLAAEMLIEKHWRPEASS